MNNETLIFEGNRKKAVLLLLASAAFVSIGIFLIGKEDAKWILFIIGFFGLCLLVSIYMLIPGTIRLKIDRSGIEMKTLFKPMKLVWSDIDGFYVGKIQVGLSSTKMIGIQFSDSYKKLKTGRKLSASLTGMEGALPNHFNKSAEELCEILNRYKQQWGRGA